MKTSYILSMAMGASLALAACSHNMTKATPTEDRGATAAPTPVPVHNAKAMIEGTGKGKHQVKGTVEFKQDGTQTVVHVELAGLKPRSTHGIHVHENGTCTAPDFKSAGGHYNPTGQPHAAPDAPAHHFGDLGNVVADKHGKVSTDLTIQEDMVSDGSRSVIGKAIIVHAGKDDLHTQPSGDSGDRIGCGVISGI